MRDLEGDDEFPPATDEEQRQVWFDMALQNELFRFAAPRCRTYFLAFAPLFSTIKRFPL